MKIEVNKYYRTRDGNKAYIGFNIREIDKECVGESAGSDQFLFRGATKGCAISSWTVEGNWCDSGEESEHDLVAPWEDEQEEIDVGAMWVGVYHPDGDKRWIDITTPISEMAVVSGSWIAIVTVSDWIDIQQGKRKLIVGEGL